MPAPLCSATQGALPSAPLRRGGHASASGTKSSVIAWLGFTSMPIALACGTSSESRSSSLDIKSMMMLLKPVRLPSGRARLAKAHPDWVADVGEDDRDRRGCVFRR